MGYATEWYNDKPDFTTADLVPVTYGEATTGVDAALPRRVKNDFDGDGRSDLGCYYAQSSFWYIMQSYEGFRTEVFGDAGSMPITGDFDGDGRLDYGYYVPVTGSWEIALSAGRTRTETSGYAGTIPLVGDFDGDGVTDFGCYDAAGLVAGWVNSPP